MSSTSKDSASSIKKNKPIQQLNCMNIFCTRQCKKFVGVDNMMCRYYRTQYKPHKRVCNDCFNKYTRVTKNSEKSMKGHFPNYDTSLVTDLFNDDGDKIDEIEKPKPTASKENFNYLETEIISCKKPTVEVGALVLQAEDNIRKTRNTLDDLNRPIITELGSVDFDEPEKEEANKTVKKKDNKTEIENHTKKNITTGEYKMDKEEHVIAVNKTVCFFPADLPKEGPLEYPLLQDGQFVYYMKNSLTLPWYKGKLNTVINNYDVYIKFDSEDKLLTTKQIAFYTPNSVRFPVGSRVIAKIIDSDYKVDYYFYAGVIAETPEPINKFRYMIFFDNGHVQYQHHNDIRLIVHKSNQVWNDVHPDFKDFIQSYLQNYPDREMVRLTQNRCVKVEYKYQWHSAKVLEVDASMVKLFFKDLKQSEWLYRGSSRLWNIYEKKSKCEKNIRLRQSGSAYRNKPFFENTKIEKKPTVHKSTRELKSRDKTKEPTETYKNYSAAFNIVTVPLPKTVLRPRPLVKHNCNISCIDWTGYDFNKTVQINMLAIPLHFGFDRYLAYCNNNENCFVLYKTPCGRTIRNLEETNNYLISTNSSMTVDQFEFSNWINPLSEYKVLKSIQFVEDISAGKEFKSITCVNTINTELPAPMKYITVRQPMSGVNMNVDGDFLCKCDCTDNCEDKLKCACWKMTLERVKIIPSECMDPNLGYNYRRLYEPVVTGIYECNKTCKCSRLCSNRVVQQPLSQNLQLFFTKNKGWGVRCLNDIPQGSFICTYVGDIFTETDANKRGKIYGDEFFAELDYIEVASSFKENYILCFDKNNLKDNQCVSPELSDEDYQLSEGKRKRTKNRKNTNKNVRYARNKKNNPKPSKLMRKYFGDNTNMYIVDSKSSGNISRYINHSCSPNTFIQNVFVDTQDLRFPWVSMFAKCYIKAGTELTWNYNYEVGSVRGRKIKCQCESANCRGRLL